MPVKNLRLAAGKSEIKFSPRKRDPDAARLHNPDAINQRRCTRYSIATISIS